MRQAPLGEHLDRALDGNPHDSGVLVDPGVFLERLVLLRAQGGDVRERVRLQARPRRQRTLDHLGHRVALPLLRHLARVEILVEADDESGNRQRQD